LLEVRDDRVHTGLPILVVTHDDLNEKERQIVTELATVRARPSEAPAALERLLEVSFPLAVVPDAEA
jgi:hypothetical protein